MIEIPPKIRRRQHLCLGAGVSLAIAILGVYTFKPDFTSEAKPAAEKKINTATEVMDAQKTWLYKLSEEAVSNNQKLEATSKKLERADKEIEELKQTMLDMMERRPNITQEGGADNHKLDEVYARLMMLEAKLNHLVERTPVQPVAKSQAKPQSGISKFVMGSNKTNAKTVDDNIPAGAFAEAVLLGGVDATTSLNASSDPRPVLLRVVDRGTLPNRFRSEICDCHVLGGSYGDLSSERVFVRLEKLTCIDKKTKVITETQIAGYVAGEDGRAGMRGIVVARDDKLMRNALTGGILGGISRGLSLANTNNRSTTVSSLGITSMQTGSDILKSGTGEGVASALDRYAKYYIDRAEQLQPVIQVAAGRKVTIVFTQGTKFGQKTAVDEIKSARLASRHDEANSNGLDQTMERNIRGIN